jgi:pyruvate dehydrogenase E1 component alpha subunit
VANRQSEKTATLISPDVLDETTLYRVLGYDGSIVGELPEIAGDKLRKIYETMLLIRLLDERMMILQRQGRIGFYGACTGQEATPIAAAAALEDRDWIFPALREGAAMLYRGFSLETYICQVFGNAGDVTKGRQMPSHQAARSVNQVSWGSCLGSQLPQAMGAAWGAKLRNDDVVTVGYIGDGATSEADFHNALNFAGVYKVPCIFICQNNQWAISTPTDRQTNSRNIAEKAVAYGLPYALVDGNDVLAIYAAVKEAAVRARAGEGSTFLEMLTYRIGAHSSSDDPRVYRDDAEVEEWKKRDPLERFCAFLIENGHWTKADEAQIRARIDQEILDAVKTAEARPAPEHKTLIEDVYAEIPRHLQEQFDAYKDC